jgi:RHS repeat-associated protein
MRMPWGLKRYQQAGDLHFWQAGSSRFQNGYVSGNHVSGFSYDGMGDVTNDGSYAYTYDAEGRPLTAGGVAITYDAFGRAIQWLNGSSYTQAVYSPTGQKFAFMNGSTVEQYMVPMVAGMKAVYNGSGLQRYQHADWLGSNRFSATPTGTVYYDGAYAPFGENYAEMGTHDRALTGQTQDILVGSYEFQFRQYRDQQGRWLGSVRLDSTPSQTMYFDGAYAPFGDQYAGAGTSDRVFTGQTQDMVSARTDFLFRQYSSTQGRWIVPDPAGLAAVDPTNPQTWNRYAYVANNPLSNVDPLGLKCQPTHIPVRAYKDKQGKWHLIWEFVWLGCNGISNGSWGFSSSGYWDWTPPDTIPPGDPLF